VELPLGGCHPANPVSDVRGNEKEREG